MKNTTINHNTFLAIAKAFGEKTTAFAEARAKAKPGEHKIEDVVVLDVRGILKVGTDFLTTPTPRLSGLKLAAAFRQVLRDEGISTQKAVALVKKAIEVALLNPADLDEDEVEQIETDIKSIQKAAKKALEPEDRKGQVRWNGLATAEKSKPDFARAAVM
jgi:hypothetical protein